MLQQVRHPQLLLGEDRPQKLSATPCQARPGTLTPVYPAPGVCLCLLCLHPVLSTTLLCDLCASYPTLTYSALVLELAACLSATWLAAGEFEEHANCWMGWPDSGYLWRDDAKPAQEQYAEIAKAISQFEPVVMMANPEVSPLLQLIIVMWGMCRVMHQQLQQLFMHLLQGLLYFKPMFIIQ